MFNVPNVTPPTTDPKPTEPPKPAIVLPGIETAEGVLARVLLAESRSPFHKEYDADEVLKAMQIMKAVYENRLKDPSRYGARGADDIVDVIVAAGQTAGFTRNEAGEIVISGAVQARIDDILARANAGPPGRFSTLVQNATDVANGTIESIDPFANRGGVVGFRTEGARPPGGDLQAVPENEGGVVAGQQFYILRTRPQKPPSASGNVDP